MKFLLALSKREMTEDIWHAEIKRLINKRGGEVEVLDTPDNVLRAIELLSDPNIEYHEVISGSFGGLDGGDWTRIRDAAASRPIRLTLLSGGFTDGKIKELEKQGLGVIDKDHFGVSIGLFLEDRLPQEPLKER